jgi:hypothetical protein
MRRPSPAIVIATGALFIALSGTAYAATGGTFILGKPNTAKSVTALTNSAGTALSLSSKAGTPPLTVNSGVQVPNLNASVVDGYSAYSFVHGSGTAFVVWGGPLTLDALTTSPNTATLVDAPPSDLIWLTADCDTNNSIPGAQITLYNYSGSSAQYSYLDSGGAGGGILANGTSGPASSYSLNPDVSTIQVFAGSQILTFTAQFQINTNSAPDVCTYSAQLTSNQ